jgi:catechol 2,3-dioxygenase-like lactoylglutathione lyase family enzyme
MIQVKRLAHATITTADMERSLDYYLRVVGLSLVTRDKDRAVLATKVGHEAIVLENGPQGGLLPRLSFQIKPGTDLGELAAKLQQEGVKAERRSGITPGVKDALCFNDNKGTMLEIYSEYEFAPDDKQPIGIMPVKLGHVAYRVESVVDTVKFYTEFLGFRVSDFRGDFFAFLRCGVDHHTVNFVVDPKPQLHHIAFEVKDWGEIHRAAETLAKNDIRLVWGPGRHIIGHNIACYHRNSDDVRVEMFCEMDQMKDEDLGYFEPRPWHQDRPQRPKMWGPETLRNYWGFGSERSYPGYP